MTSSIIRAEAILHYSNAKQIQKDCIFFPTGMQQSLENERLI